MIVQINGVFVATIADMPEEEAVLACLQLPVLRKALEKKHIPRDIIYTDKYINFII